MPEPLAILLTTVLLFVIGGAYYGVLGSRMAAARGGAAPAAPPMVRTMIVEVVRCLVLAVVLAVVTSWTDVTSVGGGLLLGLVLWIGFPLVLWSGAILHEGTPLALALVHGGDWLVKLLAAGALLGGLA